MNVQWLGQTTPTCPPLQYWDGTKCTYVQITPTSTTPTGTCSSAYGRLDLIANLPNGPQLVCAICVPNTALSVSGLQANLCEQLFSLVSGAYRSNTCPSGDWVRVDLVLQSAGGSQQVCSVCVPTGGCVGAGCAAVQNLCDGVVKLLSGSARLTSPASLTQPTTTTTQPTGPMVTLKRNRTYRFRTLVGYDPATTTCQQVIDFLNAAIRKGETNADWPWFTSFGSSPSLSLQVLLDPTDRLLAQSGAWPSQRTGMPYPTQNFCLIYSQGTWQAPDRQVNPNDLARILAPTPNTRFIDAWDHTDDPQALNPLADQSGMGCAPNVLVFNPATGTADCKAASVTTTTQPSTTAPSTTTPSTTTPSTTTPSTTTPSTTAPSTTTPSTQPQLPSPTQPTTTTTTTTTVPLPVPAATTQPTTPAKKSSNAPLYIGLGALVLGTLFFAGKAAS